MSITFDSNILIYAAIADSSPRHWISGVLLDRARKSDAFLCLQSLGETFYVLTRKHRVPPEKACSFIADLAETFPIVSADETCLSLAIEAHTAHRIPFWDAMLWATADRAGCDFLITEDLQDRRKLGRVTFLNPFEVPSPRELDAALAPLPET